MTRGIGDLDPGRSLLLTDLYEITMMQAYLEAGMTGTAAFEFFVRKLPRNRGFLLAAGLAQVLEFLRAARFSDTELRWLKRSRQFSGATLDHLAAFRFTGDVDAMPEGTPFFADEPILRVTAPLPQAQLLETRLINLLHFQTLIATKAARMRLAAGERTLIDFGLRRAHGAEAGLLAARASYLAGFAGSATSLAAPRFGVPVFGTMAHSFIQAHDSEEDAFLAFARARPDNAVLLLDTYDTEAAAALLVRLAPRLRAEGIALRGVRLDSGDLADHARRVRRILDRGGLDDVKIFASGGLSEWALRDLARRGAPIDGYGVGTELTTSADAPALDCAYKLQEYDGRAKRKRSEGKATWPGRKQVFRRLDRDGCPAGDIIALEHEPVEGIALLQPAMRKGRALPGLPDLAQSRAYAGEQLRRLPRRLRRLDGQPRYPVRVSRALRALARRIDRLTGPA